MHKSKKNIKWILGRVQPTNQIEKKRSKEYRVKKVTRSRKPRMIQTPEEEIKGLQDELGFICDSITTIGVIYNGLYHAYQSSATELENDKAAYYLSDKEKELLTGYAELNLKAIHLQRQLVKMEDRMSNLKEELCPHTTIETSLFDPIHFYDTIPHYFYSNQSFPYMYNS